MTPFELYQLVLPINYKLKRHQIKQLIQAETSDAFEAILNTTYYRNTFLDLHELSLEDAYTKLQQKLHKNDRKKNPYSVAVINSYFYRKENEIKKLISALECIRYGYEQKEIEAYLFKH